MMDIDEPYDVYIMCPKCKELSIQKSNDYPIVCCNTPGMTFGSGKCCKCYQSIPINPETLDLCITCSITTLSIS